MWTNQQGDKATICSQRSKSTTLNDAIFQNSPQTTECTINNNPLDVDSDSGLCNSPRIIWREPCSASLDRMYRCRNINYNDVYRKVMAPIHICQNIEDKEVSSANLLIWQKASACKYPISQSCHKLSDARSKKYATCDSDYMRNYVLHGLKNMGMKCPGREVSDIDTVVLASGNSATIPYSDFCCEEKRFPLEAFKRKEKKIIRRNQHGCPIKDEVEKCPNERMEFFKNCVLNKVTCPHRHVKNQSKDRFRAKGPCRGGKHENNRMMSAIINNDIDHCKDAISTFNLKTTLHTVRGVCTQRLIPLSQPKLSKQANKPARQRSVRKSKVIDRWTSNVIDNTLKSCMSDMIINIVLDVAEEKIEEFQNEKAAKESTAVLRPEAVDTAPVNGEDYEDPEISRIPPNDDLEDTRPAGSRTLSETSEVYLEKRDESIPIDTLPPGIVPPVIVIPGDAIPEIDPEGINIIKEDSIKVSTISEGLGTAVTAKEKDDESRHSEVASFKQDQEDTKFRPDQEIAAEENTKSLAEEGVEALEHTKSGSEEGIAAKEKSRSIEGIAALDIAKSRSGERTSANENSKSRSIEGIAALDIAKSRSGEGNSKSLARDNTISQPEEGITIRGPHSADSSVNVVLDNLEDNEGSINFAANGVPLIQVGNKSKSRSKDSQRGSSIKPIQVIESSEETVIYTGPKRPYVEKSMVKSMLQKEKKAAKKANENFQMGQVHDSIFGKCQKPMIVPISVSIRSANLIKNLTSHSVCGSKQLKKPLPIIGRNETVNVASRICPVPPNKCVPTTRFPLPVCCNKTGYSRLKYSKSCDRNFIRQLPVCTVQQYVCPPSHFDQAIRCQTLCNFPGQNNIKCMVIPHEHIRNLSTSR